MKSSFKIDFADLTGEGFEPIIKVVIGDEDMEDKLLKTLFQSTDNLNINYCDPITENGTNNNFILSKSRVFNLSHDR